MKVLIVDDEPPLREVLQLCRERSGYCVRSADGPLAAFSILQELVLEVVICDLLLAGMNGIEFCSTVSELLPKVRLFLIRRRANRRELRTVPRPLEANFDKRRALSSSGQRSYRIHSGVSAGYSNQELFGSVFRKKAYKFFNRM